MQDYTVTQFEFHVIKEKQKILLDTS